jgi:uncharacterized protein YggE
MKSTNLILTAAALFLAVGFYCFVTCAGRAGSQEADVKQTSDKRTVTTSGMATIRTRPDSARLFFRVETYAGQLKDARAENGRLGQKIFQAVNALSIEKLKMKSDNVNVTVVTSQQRAGVSDLPKILGYHIVSTFTVLVERDDPAKLTQDAARVLDTALENGATGVERVAFFRKDTTKLRHEALAQAVRDALANARALARGAGESVKDSLTISETPRAYFGGDALTNALVQGGASPHSDGTPLLLGELEITCRVSVTCRY